MKILQTIVQILYYQLMVKNVRRNLVWVVVIEVFTFISQNRLMKFNTCSLGTINTLVKLEYSFLNLNEYGAFSPIFPSLAEQHRIVERIEELMGKIEMI